MEYEVDRVRLELSRLSLDLNHTTAVLDRTRAELARVRAERDGLISSSVAHGVEMLAGMTKREAIIAMAIDTLVNAACAKVAGDVAAALAEHDRKFSQEGSP